MAVHLDIAPALLRWAVDRAGWDTETAVRRFPQFDEWITRTRQPTLKQAEQFARATHAPFGQLFLPDPPSEPLPVPDLRTMRDAGIEKPSGDLLDTLYLCQARQDWYRDYAVENGLDPVSYVGTMTTEVDPAVAAQRVRDVLDLQTSVGPLASDGTAAFRLLVDRIEATGALVMVNGVVGSNTHRALRPEEFRGFTLVDDFAPLVFVNGADTKAAQIFTVIHEFAHVWLGGSALSDVEIDEHAAHPVERWCNAVAAEVLVPEEALRTAFHDDLSPEELDALARRFTVSTLVVLRRIADAGYLTWDEFRARYVDEQRRVLELLNAQKDHGGGGDYYNVQPQRLSRQFARAVIASTHEGDTSYRDAYRLLGTKKHSTFEELAERIGAR